MVNTSEETSKDYTLRVFKVSRRDMEQEEPRKIFHFHFLGWPGMFIIMEYNIMQAKKNGSYLEGS